MTVWMKRDNNNLGDKKYKLEDLNILCNAESDVF